MNLRLRPPRPPSESTTVAAVALILVVAIWGATFAVVKLVVDQWAPFVFLGLRFWVATVALAPLVWWERRRLGPPTPAQFRALAIRSTLSGMALFLAYACQTYGIKWTSADTGAFMTNLFVVLVPLLYLILYRVWPGRTELFATGLALVGAFIFTRASINTPSEGIMLLLIGAICYAAQIVVVGEHSMDDRSGFTSPITFTAIQLAVVALASTLLAPIFTPARELVVPTDPRFLFAVLFCAFLATSLAYSIQTWSQQRLTPTQTGLFFSLEPVFALIASYFLTHEVLSVWQFVGGILILAAVLCSDVGRRQKAHFTESVVPVEQETNHPPPEKVRTLILKGGGVKGLAFAGALEVLDRQGYRFRNYVGSSAGSIAAVLLAAGYTPAQLQEQFMNAPFREFMDADPVRAIWNLLTRGGMYPGRVLMDWIRDKLERRPEAPRSETRIELKTITSGSDRRVIVFATHPWLGTTPMDSAGRHANVEAHFAVRLSCSIPFFFTPERLDGFRMYDGGLLNNLPIEAYQRMRREETRGAPVEEDFLALYIGRPARATEGWWARELLDILLTRDDVVIPQQDHDRCMLIDTAPIRTTDFDITEDEKKYLLEVGREAAYRYVNDSDAADASRKLIAGLRPKVDASAHKRSVRAWQQMVLRTIICAGIAVAAGIALLSAAIAPEHYAIQNVAHRTTYLEASADGSASVRRLPDFTKTEIDELCTKTYGPAYGVDDCAFESLVQVVVLGNASATKLVVGGGKVPTHGSRRLVVTSALNLRNCQSASQLYVRENWKWQPARCTGNMVEFEGGAVDRAFDLQNCAGAGGDVRIVTVTDCTFPDSWERDPAPVTAWVLGAHRTLAARGQATYLFIKESASRERIEVIPVIYVRDASDSAHYVAQPPRRSLNSERAWQRIRDALNFLEQLDASELPEGSTDAVNRIRRNIESAQAEFDRGQSTDLIFTFDPGEFPYSHQEFAKRNAIILVRNRTITEADDE